SNTIIGTLPGKSEDIILIGTHTDSTFTGAFDNAAANSGLIFLAKYYANIPLENRGFQREWSIKIQCDLVSL
ncbi:MAG: M28 family peptidase, partial [Promethearchaeota archaeon]